MPSQPSGSGDRRAQLRFVVGRDQVDFGLDGQPVTQRRLQRGQQRVVGVEVTDQQQAGRMVGRFVQRCRLPLQRE